MSDFFLRLFSTDFMPHVYCLRSPTLVWLQAISDGLIAIAYLLIPFGLVRLLQKRRDMAFHWLFLLFALFILSCGATHVLGIVTLWIPIYRFDTLIKAITAVASIATAFLLIRLIPKIAKMPSPDQWQRSNEKLVAEINQRETAETSLRLLNASLEERIAARTRELEANNLILQDLTAAWDLSHGLIRDSRGVITFWCEGSEQLYGWSKAEAVGRSSHELLKTVFPRHLSEIEVELQAKGSWSGELVHFAKSGLQLHVATHWTLRRSSGGCPLSVIEINNDITDRLRAKEATQRLADLVDSSSDAIIASDPDGTITSWNTSAERLFEYSAAEMIGKPVNLLAPVLHFETETSVAESVGRGAGAKQYEATRFTKTGRELTVALTVSPIRNSAGEVIGTSQIVHDISDLKAQQEAFRLSEERQRLAVEAGQVGLWYLDTNDKTVIWTQRCKELHGLNPDSVVPDFPGPLAMIHPEDRPALEEAVRRTIEEKVDLSMEYRTRGLDFRTHWLQTMGQVQLDANGKVQGVHGTVIDLTARKEMEDKLRRANTELEQFAYAAAHDLQEPLRNVALAAALLQVERAEVSQEPEPPLLTAVVENARRMEAMVKDLLAYSRALDASEHEDARADGNIVFGKVLQNLSLAVEEKLAIVTRDDMPLVAIRETHLLQILQNLIANALKYSGQAHPKIHVGAKIRPGDVLLWVKDNGIGIAPQFHSRAFGMFKRLHQDRVKGTGIGLAVCKRIVEHYGGTIWIESQTGAGATFFFTTPSVADPMSSR